MLRAAAILAVVGLLLWPGEMEAGWSEPTDTLTSANAVHSLTPEAAARSYPVHLRAVVTYFDPFTDPKQTAMFVHDRTGSVYVFVQPGSIPLITPGTVVEITGVTSPGNFAPIVAESRVVVVGRAALPPLPPLSSPARLRTGSYDGRWVRVGGVVHAVVDLGRTVILQVSTDDGLQSVAMLKEPGYEYARLIDAAIRVAGNVSPLFNGSGQLFGVRLVSPGASEIEVIKAPAPDPFGLPVVAVSSLSRYSPVTDSPHRIHIRGIVTLQWPGSTLCIRDATRSLCAQTSETSPVAADAVVDVVGFPSLGNDAPVLTDAIYQPTAQRGHVAAQPLGADLSMWIHHDADLVEVTGRLIRKDTLTENTVLLLDTGPFVVPVLVPAEAGVRARTWKEGARLRVTGICAVRLDALNTARAGGNPVIESMRVLLRSGADVVVVQKASWWTPANGVLLLACALSLTLVVLVWVVMLRKRVRESEARFRHMAQHDALTGLPTRSLLHERLDAALARSKRCGSNLALLMLDLDKFKYINDTFGHPAGDQTLIVTAQRLMHSVRQSDTVARMGGDEFVVLLVDINDPAEAQRIAEKIVAALSAPVLAGGRLLPLTTSVGVSTLVAGALSAGALLKRADTALYHAKAKGRNCFQLYTAEMAEEALAKSCLEQGLAQAVSRNELELHYQPLIDLGTGELTGFEALLRWRSQALGLIVPSDFIALAEESGLIVSIGEWVLQQACRQIGLLERQSGRRFRLAVNLSPRQLEEPGLIPMIKRTLAACGRKPEQIEFEVTESMLMSDSVVTQNTLMELRTLGLRIAIDDFGMGFSSLSYITRFAIDSLKIDRSFIQACTEDRNSQAVVKAIIAMANDLKIDVVAEGVETIAQFDFLRREGCETGQGFLLGRPAAAHELPALVSGFGTAAVAVKREDAGPMGATSVEQAVGCGARSGMAGLPGSAYAEAAPSTSG